MKHRTGIETEVKVRVPDLEKLRTRLEGQGFALTAPLQPESSVLWDRAGELLAQGAALRLRRFGDRAWLTWKGPTIPDALLKIRPEEETAVEDPEAVERILGALGFAPVLRMEKRRALLQREDLLACLDETPFGCFVELEGEPAAIQRAMAALELSPAEVETRSYPALFRAHGLV